MLKIRPILKFGTLLIGFGYCQLVETAGSQTNVQAGLENRVVQIAIAGAARQAGAQWPDVPADTGICAKLVGTWLIKGDAHSCSSYLTFRADGSYLARILEKETNSIFEGTWRVKNGIVTTTTTNLIGPGTACTVDAKVMRLTNREFTYEVLDDPHFEKYTISLTRKNCR